MRSLPHDACAIWACGRRGWWSGARRGSDRTPSCSVNWWVCTAPSRAVPVRPRRRDSSSRAAGLGPGAQLGDEHRGEERRRGRRPLGVGGLQVDDGRRRWRPSPLRWRVITSSESGEEGLGPASSVGEVEAPTSLPSAAGDGVLERRGAGRGRPRPRRGGERRAQSAG